MTPTDAFPPTSPTRPTRTRTHVAVYCGSAWGANPVYALSARALGTAIARRGLTLVYGGGRLGLMGEVADAALHAGGRVTGVITTLLKDKEVGHERLSELLVVETMHQRKQAIADLAHAYIALPGGVGTLDELFEILAWAQLGIHACPVGILNTRGYYDHLLAFLKNAEAERFLRIDLHQALLISTEPDNLIDRLTNQQNASPTDH